MPSLRRGAGLGFELPGSGDFGVGMVFLPTESTSRQACERKFEEICG